MIPGSWMPPAKMLRIICHWSAGGHRASALDRQHYHIMVEADGKLVLGRHSIKANENPVKGRYAAHTLNCNRGSIGIAMCCMLDAKERPFVPGPAPMTKVQWNACMKAIAELCRAYRIPVTPKTVLSHAEVQNNLGIKQRGKWDIARLAFDPSFDTARECGDRMRAEVSALLK